MYLFEILNKYCDYHHTAYAIGYVKVNYLVLNRYTGKYGTGFTLHSHAAETNNYHHIQYYIFKENNKFHELLKDLLDKV